MLIVMLMTLMLTTSAASGREARSHALKVQTAHPLSTLPTPNLAQLANTQTGHRRISLPSQRRSEVQDGSRRTMRVRYVYVYVSQPLPVLPVPNITLSSGRRAGAA